MNVLVLIAGVHDPKWPIALGSDDAGLPAADHQLLSPFDEAALEIALRLRDARPDTRIAARVADGGAGMKIARTIAALNIADVSTVELADPWDQGAMARALASLCEGADLILMGREFGDFDDGLIPALVAGSLEVPFFAHVQTVEAKDDVRFMREADSCIETLKVSGRLVASVTNDRRTRLRKPLMKNVMLARQAPIGEAVAGHVPTAGLALEAIVARNVGRSQTSCAIIAGPPEMQARALATLLWEARQ